MEKYSWVILFLLFYIIEVPYSYIMKVPQFKKINLVGLQKRKAVLTYIKSQESTYLVDLLVEQEQRRHAR